MSGKISFAEIIYVQKEGVAMGWLEDIVSSIKYMERHLTDELTVEKIAAEVHLSPFYFQKGFSILCGVIIYILAVFLLKILKKEDILMIPFGTKIYPILVKLKIYKEE